MNQVEKITNLIKRTVGGGGHEDWYMELEDGIADLIKQERQLLIEWVEKEMIGNDQGVIEKNNLGEDIVLFGKSEWLDSQNKLRAKMRKKLTEVK